MAKTKQPIIFKRIRRAPCPACLDREALNLVGRPRWYHGFKLTGGCEVCHGDGEVWEAILVGDPTKDLWAL